MYFISKAINCSNLKSKQTCPSFWLWKEGKWNGKRMKKIANVWELSWRVFFPINRANVFEHVGWLISRGVHMHLWLKAGLWRTAATNFPYQLSIFVQQPDGTFECEWMNEDKAVDVSIEHASHVRRANIYQGRKEFFKSVSGMLN